MIGSHPHQPSPHETPGAIRDCWPPRTDEDLAAGRLGFGIRLHLSVEVISRLPDSPHVDITIECEREPDIAVSVPAAEAA